MKNYIHLLRNLATLFQYLYQMCALTGVLLKLAVVSSDLRMAIWWLEKDMQWLSHALPMLQLAHVGHG